jgi:DNA-directed RNA polymerase subunit RPC12/RpoP
MAIQCPRCGQEVQQGSNTGAVVAGGLVGAMLHSAFSSYECWQCGKIAKEEFPPEVQSQMNSKAVVLVAGAIVLALVAVAVIVAIGST